MPFGQEFLSPILVELATNRFIHLKSGTRTLLVDLCSNSVILSINRPRFNLQTSKRYRVVVRWVVSDPNNWII